MTKVRLNKFLAEAGTCSRRKADGLINSGKIFVNDKIADIGMRVDSENDEIKFENKILSKPEKLIYYAFYKPKGIVTTASDEKGRKTVLDFLPEKPRVFPVGRLDKDSEGLLILTNDGELAQKLTHPKFEHEKEYIVKCRAFNSKFSDASQIQKDFTNGMMIDGKLMAADNVKISKKEDSKIEILITIHTGANRQIRRMCDKIGLEVLKLKRTRIGNLKMDNLNLKPGEFKTIQKPDLIF